MIGQNPFTEEGRTRFRNFERRLGGYLLLALLIGGGVGYCVFRFWTRAQMMPLQKLYLRQYTLGSLKAVASGKSVSRYQLLTCQVTDAATGRVATGGVTDAQVHPVRDAEGRPVRDENGYVFAWNAAVRPAARGALVWQKVKVNDRQMVALMRENNYDGTSLSGLLLPSLIVGLMAFVGVAVGLVVWDQRLNKKYEQGRFIRGTKLVQPREYELKEGQPGLAVPTLEVKESGLLKRLYRRALAKEEPVWWLPIPRAEETFHTTILGDTGMGKSQIIHQFLRQIAARKTDETAIVYDPKGEFLASHFNAARGDIILNPLDARCPFWTPAGEIRLKTDYDLIAESFFPGSEQQRGTTSEFFIKASRSIFARLLEFNPDPRELVAWLTDENRIDEKVKGTELQHLIDPHAPQQRGGVLGSLATVGKLLRLLPAREECGAELSLTAWARERRGWIFITANKDIRDQARPLLAVFIDLLLKRSMSVEERWGQAHPCWFVVDEADSLGRLPALYGALVEGRSYGLKLIVGTQNKSQFDEKYGQKAATMLSAAALKVILRSNEPDSARWVSELIGNAEWEKPRIGTTASVSDQGRDSINYMSQIETRPVISREEIMGLPKLRGYWKYGDTVIPFRIRAVSWRARAERFIPRAAMLAGSSPTNNGSTLPEAMSAAEEPASANENGRTLPARQYAMSKGKTYQRRKPQEKKRAAEAASETTDQRVLSEADGRPKNEITTAPQTLIDLNDVGI